MELSLEISCEDTKGTGGPREELGETRDDEGEVALGGRAEHRHLHHRGWGLEDGEELVKWEGGWSFGGEQ